MENRPKDPIDSDIARELRSMELQHKAMRARLRGTVMEIEKAMMVFGFPDMEAVYCSDVDAPLMSVVRQIGNPEKGPVDLMMVAALSLAVAWRAVTAAEAAAAQILDPSKDPNDTLYI